MFVSNWLAVISAQEPPTINEFLVSGCNVDGFEYILVNSSTINLDQVVDVCNSLDEKARAASIPSAQVQKFIQRFLQDSVAEPVVFGHKALLDSNQLDAASYEPLDKSPLEENFGLTNDQFPWRNTEPNTNHSCVM